MKHPSFLLPRMAGAVGLCLAATCSVAQADQTTRVIAVFAPGATAEGKAAIAAARGEIKLDITGMDAVAAELPTEALAGLQHSPHFAYVEQDQIRTPSALVTPSTGTPYALGQLVPYGIKMVQADQLPDTYAADRTLCIVDSGYDLAHEDLNANNVSGEYEPGTGLWSTDEVHHGTHVAGTIAALNNGQGVVGVNANGHLKLHIIKVFGVAGWAYSSTLISAVNKCGAHGANVISMSLGGAGASRAEMEAFDNLARRGVLSVAAAGNAGGSSQSYPAGYPGVMSVAALDVNMHRASFSQFNDKVEIAGPGVNVLSSVPMGTGTQSQLTVGAVDYAPGGMDGSPRASVTAPLAAFGNGSAIDTSVAGKVCLIVRGAIAFSAKVLNCQLSGGVGAVVYNNVAESFLGTLGGVATTIPSVTASGVEGAAMLAQLGQAATVTVKPSNYAYFNGTSMATPHVSGVAALVWSYFPGCSAAQIRSTLDKSALDLGAPGRDVEYGYGLVQAKAAYDRLSASGCDN
jgi:subtilisin family serine protease